MCFAGCPDNPRDAALWHAGEGRPVFPCDPRTKAPLVREGFHAATLDQAQIREWWTRWPAAMIGCPMGEASGVFILDIDRKSGDPDETLDELRRAYDLPLTLLTATAGGGYHLYFHHHAGVRRSIRALHSAVDTLGEGGYAILPPSVTANGAAYRLVHDREPADPPQELLARIFATQQERPRLETIEGGVSTLPYYAEDLQLWMALDEPGSWHASQRTLVARYVSRGIDPTTITAMAPAFRRAPYSLDQTIREIGISARGAAAKFGKPVETPQGALEILDLDSLQSRDPPAWAIEGVLPEAGFVTLYGRTNTFKSFVAVDMALSVAYGRPWQGKAVKPGLALYILAEGQAAFANRVRAWRQAHGLETTGAPFHAILQPVRLGNPADVAALMQAVQARGIKPDWIWLDTLARNFGPGDPDSTKDMQGFVDACGTIQAAFKCGLALVHHAGKDTTKGARNSSVLEAAVDVEMRAEREEGSERVKLVCTKQKDAEQFAPMWLTAEKVAALDPRTGEEVTSLVMRSGDAAGTLPTPPGEPRGGIEKRILAVLQDKGTVTFSELLRAVGGDRGNFARALTGTVKKHLVIKTEDEPPFYYLATQYRNENNDL